MIRRAIDGDSAIAPLSVPASGTEHLLRLGEACEYAAAIENRTARAIVGFAIQTCIDDAVGRSDRPVGQLDVVYLATMTEPVFAVSPHFLRLILAGEGWKLDWE